MSLEANKAAIRRMVEEAWNKGNLAVLDDICAPDYVVQGPLGRGDLASMRAGMAALLAGFPDLQCTIEDMLAEGDTVAFRWTIRGTHGGEYEGLAPTGKPVQTTGITIQRFVAGKIVEDHFEARSPDFKQQLL
jgi:predicted ester cyclase